MGSRLHFSSGRSRFLVGTLTLVVLLALGSGQWAAEPVSAQRSTVPTRTPVPAAQPASEAAPLPTETLAPEATPEVAPAEVLPAVGAWEPAALG